MNPGRLIVALEQIKALADESLHAAREQGGLRSTKKSSVQPKDHISLQIDFKKPLRPFIKTHAKGFSGPKKFVLLLSWFAKGDLKREVSLAEIEGHWNRMTSLLGMNFNRFFPAQAKDNDWVESKKKGL